MATNLREPVLATLLALTVWAAGHGAAAAQQTNHSQLRFDVHLDLGWYRDVGVGFRVDIPIVPQGLVEGVDDDLSLSPGADLLWFYHRDDGGVGLYPILALQWNFYLSPKWSVFPELGMALLFAPNRDRYWRSIAAPFLGAGVRYHFNSRNALLIRLGWPAGLQVGITF